MSAKARRLIKQAVRLYLKEDGASPIGSYRDVITDVLHLARKDICPDLRKQSLDFLNHWICAMGFESFHEELENAELERMNRISDKDLPLHSIDEFKFDTVQHQFEERLKTGDPDGKETHLHNLRKKDCKSNKTSRR